MNTPAVALGVFYGLLSAIICYWVSTVASGIFARPIYRLYAKVLIGTCSVMLLAPGLHWLASSADPRIATIMLTLAQYLAFGILSYGTWRFNRDYMQQLFLQRGVAAYFTFGTLANAAIVTMAFLHISITATPGWRESAVGYVTAVNYGPILVLLAALIFHTDYRLKSSQNDLRRFSRFTFIGYAASFVGVTLSLMPYLGRAVGKLQLVALDSPLLQNFHSAQALLFAIVLYAWMVWQYESVAPLWVLLAAIIGEYHVLVTQWITDRYGLASWGIASLPLVTAIVALDYYFSDWEQRRQTANNLASERTQRFVLPFRVIGSVLALSLLGITLWTRFGIPGVGTPGWLAVTFAVYGMFFSILAVYRRQPQLIYASGVLVALSVLLGVEQIGGSSSTLILGVLAVCGVLFATTGERLGLKSAWRTPLIDCLILIACTLVSLVFFRHLAGDSPYYFHIVNGIDAVALGCAAVVFLFAAYQYRSRLPVIGAMVAMAIMVPPWSAALGLAAILASEAIKRKFTSEPGGLTAIQRIRAFGRLDLPALDIFPTLYARPLTASAIPLAYIGLSTSVWSILQGEFGSKILVGTAISALALGLLTRAYRTHWLAVTWLLASYFAVHSMAHGLFLQSESSVLALSMHLLLASLLSLLAWISANVFSAWCESRLERVADDQHAKIDADRAFYTATVYHFVTAVTVFITALVLLTWMYKFGSLIALPIAVGLCAMVFASGASVYRTQVMSYLALGAASLSLLICRQALELPHWDGAAAIVATGSTLLACLLFGRKVLSGAAPPTHSKPWCKPLPFLQASGLELWICPLINHAMLCSLVAVWDVTEISNISPDPLVLSANASLVFLLVSLTWLLSTVVVRRPLIYLFSILAGFASIHTAVALPTTLLQSIRQEPWLHLLGASGMSAAGVLLATGIAIGFNWRAARNRREIPAGLTQLRTFYAGILMNVAFVASLITLVGSAWETFYDEQFDIQSRIVKVAVGPLLFATFSLLSYVYRSRIPSYCSLAAAYFTLHGLVSLWAPAALQTEYLTLAVAVYAAVLGVISWASDRRSTKARRTSIEIDNISPQLLDCWSNFPLPVVSFEGSLWRRPLAQGSGLFALVATGLVGVSFGLEKTSEASIWLRVMPLYLSAVAFLLGSRFSTCSAMSQANALGSRVDDRMTVFTLAQDSIEKGTLFLVSLVVNSVATHLALHLTILSNLPANETLGWHLLLGAVEAITGWTLAGVLAAYSDKSSSPANASVSQTGSSQLSHYCILLHHAALITALLIFSFLCANAWQPMTASTQLFGALSVLAIYFFLAARSYQSPIFTYVAAVVLSIMATRLFALFSESDTYLGISFTALSLGFWVVGFASEFWVGKKRASKSETTSEFATQIYLRPFVQYSALLAVLGVGQSLTLLLNSGWESSRTAIAMVFALSTLALLLNSRSLSIMQREQLARLVVYLACLSLTVSWLAAWTMTWGTFRDFGSSAAGAALVLAIASWVMVAGARSTQATPFNSKLWLTFGEPMSNYATVPFFAAIVYSCVSCFRGMPSELEDLAVLRLDRTLVLTTGLTLFISSLTCLVHAQVHRGSVWMYASVAIGSCSVMFLLKGLTDWSTTPMAISCLVFMNLLVALAFGLQSRIKESGTLLGFSISIYQRPVYEIALAVSYAMLCGQVFYLVWAYGGLGVKLSAGDAVAQPSINWPWLTINVLTAGVFLQCLRLTKDVAFAHYAIGSSLVAFAGTGLTATWYITPDIAFVLLAMVWGGTSIAMSYKIGERFVRLIGLPPDGNWQVQLETVLRNWATVLFGLALLSTLPVHLVLRPDYPNVFLVVLLVAIAALIGSLRWRNVDSMNLAAALFPLSLASLAFYFGLRELALINGALICALLSLTYQILSSRIDPQKPDESSSSYWIGVGNALSGVSCWLNVCVIILSLASIAWNSPPQPTVLALAVVSFCWLWGALRAQDERLAYAAILGFFFTAIAGCVAIWNIPIVANLTVAFSIIAYCFFLYGVNIFVSRSDRGRRYVFLKPSYYTALALPLSLAVAIPFQERGPAAFLLLATGAFYLMVSHQSQKRWTIYVASALLNFAIYMWLPLASSLTGIYQLYVIPAAITVLVFAHLHRHELKPQVLSSIRLTASGCILAVSSFEALFSKDSSSLILFLVVLILSIAIIAVGIAIRIKPFIHTGLAFLVMNVVFQLGLQFHREGGIARAVILIGVGIAVLSLMVFFNIHRERILQQYRAFLASCD